MGRLAMKFGCLKTDRWVCPCPPPPKANIDRAEGEWVVVPPAGATRSGAGTSSIAERANQRDGKDTGCRRRGSQRLPGRRMVSDFRTSGYDLPDIDPDLMPASLLAAIPFFVETDLIAPNEDDADACRGYLSVEGFGMAELLRKV
mmetsp:Transcript_17738/g.23963  ORF Transcript_17738/g.23963 Transcript_17738/m.23963 type:complete len:145 (+) Transcript_17738:1432-1866(+)